MDITETIGKRVRCVSCGDGYLCLLARDYHATELDLVEVDGIVHGGQCDGCAGIWHDSGNSQRRGYYLETSKK